MEKGGESMRWKFACIGIVFLGVAYLFFNLSEEEAKSKESRIVIKKVLKNQVKSLRKEVNQALEKASKQAHLFIQLQRKGDWRAAQRVLQQFSPLYFIFLKQKSEPVMYHRGKTTGTKAFQKFAEKLLQSPSKKQAYWENSKGKGFIVRKYTSHNETFVVAFHTRKLFSRIGIKGVLQPWIALKDGTIIYHSLSYHMGENASNVKAVALARENATTQSDKESVSNYLNIRGEEVLGAFTYIPTQNLLLGNEWLGKLWMGNNTNPYYWVMIFAVFLGAAMLGLSVTHEKLVMKEVKPTLHDIDEEAKKFVQESKEYIERAHGLIAQKEQEWEKIQKKTQKDVAIAERTKWILELTESLLDEAMEAPNAEDAWTVLSESLYTLTQNAPNVVFRYSRSSCCLIPQACSGMANFPESAQRYMKHSRILLGNYRHAFQLEKSSAFSNWKEKWAKHMPVHEWKLYHLPFANTSIGSKGSVLLLLNPELHTDNEIAKERKLWDSFTHRAAWLYDTKKRLLQLSYARSKIAQHKKNKAGDRPTPT